MILLREASEPDLDDLVALSRLAAEFHPGFLNIVNDRDQWKEKIKLSTDSFADKIADKMDAKYVFVADDLAKKRVVGVSMVSARHGTPEVPHFFLEVGTERKFSQTLNTGFIHGTLKLKYDIDGLTEIGGLLIDPQYRHTQARAGRQISFVRFLYMGAHKTKFRKRVIAELLPPLTKKGKSSLWEAVGRRFTGLDYPEADALSLKNKEFILSLFPSQKIYVTFLPAEARNAIGKVSKDTEPVLHMLKKIGFKYRNQVDPFDGGPHLTAGFDEIVPIRKTKTYAYGGSGSPAGAAEASGLLAPVVKGSRFIALACDIKIQNQKAFFPTHAAAALGLKAGDQIWFMPYY